MAVRRRVLLAFWAVMNPVARRLAGIAPWWIVLETRGRRTGRRRQTPLARGPLEGDTLWLLAVHGRHSFWVKNLEADARVRVRLARAWMEGRASVEPITPERLARFSRYARSGPRLVGIDPLLVRVELDPARRAARSPSAGRSRAPRDR